MSIPPAVGTLIVANIALFLLQGAMPESLLYNFALWPVGAGFHSPAEWLDKASIAPRIRLLKRVVSML